MTMSGEYVNMIRRGTFERDCSRFDKVRFINMVRKHEALYNHHHPHFAVKNCIDAIYEKIASEVGLKGIESARNKWKSLKICYKFHKLKYMNHTNGKNKKPHKKWPYFEMMQFLDPYTVTRKKSYTGSACLSSIREPTSVSTCSYPSDASSHQMIETGSDADPKPDQYNYVKPEPVYQVEDRDIVLNSNANLQRASTIEEWPAAAEAMVMRHVTSSSVADNTSAVQSATLAGEIVTAVRESAKGVEAAIASASRLEHDENAQYGRFIASRLRKLTPRQKHRIRKGIEDVFYEIESELLQHASTTDALA